MVNYENMRAYLMFDQVILYMLKTITVDQRVVENRLEVLLCRVQKWHIRKKK